MNILIFNLKNNRHLEDELPGIVLLVQNILRTVCLHKCAFKNVMNLL